MTTPESYEFIFLRMRGRTRLELFDSLEMLFVPESHYLGRIRRVVVADISKEKKPSDHIW